MNTKVEFGLCAIGLVVGMVLGFFMFHGAALLNGVTVTPSNAQDNQALVNELQAIVNPELGWLSANAVLGNLTVSSSSVASTSITLAGAMPGDWLEWSESTSTQGVILSCTISSSSTVECYKTAGLSGNNTFAAVTSTIFLQDLPKASFVSPTTL